MNFLVSFLFVLCSIICVPVSAQEWLFRVQYFGIEEGLSHRDVECIQQDKQGFIWMGTNYGLNRFDGYEFKWFTKEKHGLQTNTINHILQDDEGLLWLFNTSFRVHHTPQSIDLFNPVTEEVISFEEKFGENLPFNIKEITSFAASPDDRIAMVTSNKKLILYSHKKGFEVSELNVYPLLLEMFSRHGTIWGYSSTDDPTLRNVIVEIDLKGNVRNRYEHDFPFQYNYIANVDKDDNLWYISKYWYDGRFDDHQKGRLFRIDSQGIEKEFLLEKTALPPNAINLDNPADDNNYGFWMNPMSGNFWLFDRNGFQCFHPLSGWYQQWGSTEFASNSPNTVFFDGQKRAWIGTEFGLYIIELSKNPFKIFGHDKSGKKRNAYRGITEDSNHTLWACIDRGDGWLGRFKKEKHHYESEISGWENSEWGLGYKYGIFTDSKGFVWFGSGEVNSITKYNPKENNFQRISYFIPRKAEGQQVNIWSFYEDNSGQIWFGTDAGTVSNIGENQRVFTLPELVGVNSKGGCIYQFFTDKKGRTWVATDHGLFILDIKKKTITPYKSESLPFLDEGIYHIHEDVDGSFWMGTKGLGLINWHPGSETFEQFTQADGFSNNNIYAVYEDDFGHLWLPSDYGIIQFNKWTHLAKAYLEKDGIANQEFNRISHYKGKDGMLYFGGLNGITAFHPKDMTGENLSADLRLVLTGFEQFDGEQNRLIDRTTALRKSKTITLNPTDRFFRLEFSLLSFLNADRNQYAYRIDGIDHDWNYQRERTLQIGRLPYGKHTLHIKGQDASGKWSPQELIIPIRVLKPYYLRTWFISIVVLCILLVAFAFYKIRTNQLTRQKTQLEVEVANRTETIDFQKQQLQKQAVELLELDKLKSRFFANVSHELRTPLTLILGPISSALKSGELSTQNSTFLKKAQQSGKELLKLVGNILDLSKMEAGKMEAHPEPTSLQPFIRQTVSAFESYAERTGVQFTFEYNVKEELLLEIDREKLKTILNNFLSNALKFTPSGGAVSVIVHDLANTIRLEVSDTGRGIHSEDLPKIFNRFYQSSHIPDGQSEPPAEGGTGIGLALCYEYAELMGGKVWAESEFEHGSSFYFEFPKKEVLGVADVEQWLMDEIEPEIDSSPIHPSMANTDNRDSTTTNRHCQVLIVEDNYSLRGYLESILSSDFQIITAENGQAALDILNNENSGLKSKKITTSDCPHSLLPDLIISDIMMPVMDGFHLLEKLKGSDKWRHIPVIMLTARADIKDKLRALRIGVDDYLLKPFEEEELKARIVNLLTNYRERMAQFATGENESKETSNAKKPVITQVDAEWLKAVETVFEKIISDRNFNLEWVATQMNISSRQLSRRLQKLIGLSPSQYLQEIRLQMAKDFLLIGKFSTVKETGFAVGFRDTPYFSSLFLERFGIHPSAYLK